MLDEKLLAYLRIAAVGNEFLHYIELMIARPNTFFSSLASFLVYLGDDLGKLLYDAA